MDELMTSNEGPMAAFYEDSQIIGKQTEEFLRLVYPSYLVDKEHLDGYIDRDSAAKLQSMTFFRIVSCSADKVEKIFENVNERFEKLFTALYSINIPIAYGIVSRAGVTSLLLGVDSKVSADSVKTITRGMLSEIDMQEIDLAFSEVNDVKNGGDVNDDRNAKGGKEFYHGILAGVPSLYVKEQKQTFSLASIMRSLNGQNYTLLLIAKPVGMDAVSQDISALIKVRDQAFAVSKRNIARSNSTARNEAESTGSADGKNPIAGQVGGGIGSVAGAVVGATLGTVLIPGLGTGAGAAAGTAAGAAIFGTVAGGLGTIIGSIVGKGKTHTDSYSKSVSETITKGETISGDIQNGFALELMNYADNAIERLKGGQNSGVWQTAIAYSAENEISRDVIRACLAGELSKLDAEKLPMLAFEPEASSEILPLPKFLGDENERNGLCSYLNSAELGLLCTVPTESVPDFELRLEKKFPLVADRCEKATIQIGHVVDGKRVLENMPFGLSEKDLNKHTFVCGITGSGKTTTVKKILIEAKKPFLVIESAKKEYRNINEKTTVFTPGKPEINAPQINPFYIMPGVSPQVHIDYLKDLFNASFSFYGPMPYILEKCLHTVYKNKGWDLTLGYHPLLANTKSSTDFFDIKHTKAQYSNSSHKFLFPTMQELKDEIARYVENELKYDGEVAGNVKTAMKVRLENLCVGAKGYTFNTNESPDFDKLLSENVVFELEGLADDADKAFSVGLLVIFINEYRQVHKEISGSINTGLQHLLVIEEAHRLLKNIETERSTETSGNPKGKAVEHFTNMIAEMRSYGQGVIVAEQIPTKLAPDVIKNSSTKIVQRIVSADDQQTIANTIGIPGDDAIQLGSLETGFAYCHKEGMVLPTPVKIMDYYLSEKSEQKCLDVFVSDEMLYNADSGNRFDGINLSVIRSFFGENDYIKQKIVAFLNTLMVESKDCCVTACKNLMAFVKNEIKRNDIRLILTTNADELNADYLTELILSMMVRGVYCARTLPDNGFGTLLSETLYSPSCEKIAEIKEALKKLYDKDLAKYATVNVAALVKRSLRNSTDLPGTVREYFIEASDDTISNIEKILERS